MVRILLIWPLLTALGPSLEGCVLPIGPDFRDPPPASPIPELPPYFGTAQTMPAFETAVGLDTMKPTPFTVEIHDPNDADEITVRWMANYPPFTNGSTVPLFEVTMPPPSNHVFRFTQAFTCGDLKMAADHNICVVVSDRGFLEPKDVQDLDLAHQYSYYRDDTSVPTQTSVIGNWRITGCP
jgi:hypothetical protein